MLFVFVQLLHLNNSWSLSWVQGWKWILTGLNWNVFKPVKCSGEWGGGVNCCAVFGVSKHAIAAPCRVIAAWQAAGSWCGSYRRGKSTSLKIDADEVEQTASHPSWIVFAYIFLHKYHPVGLLMTSQQSQLSLFLYIFFSYHQFPLVDEREELRKKGKVLFWEKTES